MTRFSLITLVLGGFLGYAAMANCNQSAIRTSAPATIAQVTSGPHGQTAAQPRDAAKALQRGEAAYNRKDYGTALRELQPLAQHGNAVAQNWLGRMYQQGLGVLKNENEAVRFYRQAAAQGYAAAQSNLASMYAEGRGVPKDENEAVRLYRQAAAQGLAMGQTNLGFMYAEGRGVARDESEAVRLFQQAAAQGHAAAQGRLGLMYAEGRGVPKDESEAVRLFQQAAAQGYALGQYGMGLMYEQGWGVARDLVEAQRRFTQAAETASVTSDRTKAMQARERVARQLAPPQPSASPPTSVTPPTPLSVAPSSLPMGDASPPETLHRRALIIGNAAYPHAPLRNPINDATDMADIVRRFGFEVTLLRDADKSTMERAVEDFTTRVQRRSVGLFFFSGHGAQIDGQNYLIPIGAALDEPSDVKYRAVAADWILARMDDIGMEVKLLILDACRNNPFGRSWTRALNRGLVTMDAPKGSLIDYSTSPGKTAEDGTGRNSPYTTHLLREIPQPRRPIELMFKAVRVGVQEETKGQQTPWEASSLTGEFVFAH